MDFAHFFGWRQATKSDSKVMAQFFSLPIVLGALLIAMGGMGIYINSHSSGTLLKLNDTALGPTLAFDEIRGHLHHLSQDLLRISQQGFTADNQKALLIESKDHFKKISTQVKSLTAKSKGQAFELYLKSWSDDWEQFQIHLESDLAKPSQLKVHLPSLDKEISQSIEKMNNMSTFIEADVKDLLHQSTEFSKRASMALMITLVIGVLIGLFSSVIIVNSIRKLFITIAEGKKQLEQRQVAIDASAIVAITDTRGAIIYANDTFSELSGYSKEELIGQDHRILNSAYHSKEFFAELWSTIHRGHIWRGELRNKKKDGTYYWVQSTIVPMRDTAGKISQFISIRYEITQRKELEFQLSRAKEEALSSARAKAEFLANMSHEIRTPLNGIIGMTGILLESRLNQEQQDLAQTMKECSNGLLEIVNDILDYSKIEAGKLEIENLPFSLRNCLDQSLYLLDHKASQKGVSLSYSLSPETPLDLIGDSGRIKQILINLIGNGVKFTERGRVSVTVSSQILGNEKYEIQFAVKDNGIGIPKDRVDRLFKSFSQVDSSTSRKFGGTGLGLAISKQLAELMGGTIWVESEEGQGSTFTFTIQAQGTSAAAKPEPSDHQNMEPVSLTSVPLKILLAEDNSVNRRLALHMLKKMGYEADPATNGLEVIEAIKKKNYDIILMDVQMPEMSGLEATQYICQNFPENKRPWIIGLTANAMKEDRERGLRAGMNAYVTKPIEFKALKEALQNSLKNLRSSSSPKSETPISPIQKHEPSQKWPSINLKAIYHNIGEDSELLFSLIEIFETNSPALIQEIEDGLQRQDAEATSRAAHSLKGSAANFQTCLVVDLALQLEGVEHNHDWSGAKELLKNLKTEHQRLSVELSYLKNFSKAA